MDVKLGEEREVPLRRGESDLHKTLKKQACYWLYRSGYACVAAEVRLPPVGIVDAVGSGLFRPYHNAVHLPRELAQVCVVECKASRSDFLRDISDDGQLLLGLECRREATARRSRRRPKRRGSLVGKFDACLLYPLANLHYVLAPVGLVKKTDLPARWGLLGYGPAGVGVVVRATWQEAARPDVVEAAIARTLTGDIFRADGRAIHSVNRSLLAEQQSLAERIRKVRPMSILAPRPKPAIDPE